MTIEEFEETEHVLYNDPSAKAKAAEQLKKEEEEIKKENEAFAKGEATYTEDVYPWTADTDSEFANEMEGGLTNANTMRGLGHITKPDHLRDPTPEQKAELDEIYSRVDRAALPASYTAQEKG